MTAYWAQEPAELCTELATSGLGLTQAEAERRLERVGPNRLAANEAAGALRLMLRQYESPLVLILVFGAIVSLVVKEWLDAVIILLIVLGSTVLGFVQEYRASDAIRRLRERLRSRCMALRDGRPCRSIPEPSCRAT